MATLHGKNARLFLASSTSAAAVQISEATEWVLNIAADLAEDSAFGDTWKTNLQGLRSWTLGVSGNYDDASTTAFDAATAGGAVRCYVYPDNGTTTRYYYGLVDANGLNVTIPLGGKATMSGTLTGNGALSKNP